MIFRKWFETLKRFTLFDNRDETIETLFNSSISTIAKVFTGLTHHLIVSGYEKASEIDYYYYKQLVSDGLLSLYHTSKQLIKFKEKQTCYDSYILPKKPNNYQGTKESEEEFEKLEIICNICLEKIPDRVLIPCGHTFCSVCLSHIDTCPNCRSVINGIMKIYLN